MTGSSAFERPSFYEYEKKDTRSLSETMKKYLEYYTQEMSTLQRELLRAEINLPQEEKQMKDHYAEVRARMETIVQETEAALRTNGEQTEALFKRVEDLIAEAEGKILERKSALPDGRKRYSERMYEYWNERIRSQKFIQGERVYRGGKPMEHVVDLPNRWQVATTGIVVGTHDVSMSRKRWYLKSELPPECTFAEETETMVFRTSIEGDRAKFVLKEQAPERPKTPEEEVKTVVDAHTVDFLEWYELGVSNASRQRSVAQNFKDELRRTVAFSGKELKFVLSHERTPRRLLMMEVDPRTKQLKPFSWLASVVLDTTGVRSVQLKPEFDFENPPKELPPEARLAVYMMLGLREDQVLGGTVECTKDGENLVFIFKQKGTILGRVRVKSDGSAQKVEETAPVMPVLAESALSPEQRKIWNVVNREKMWFASWWDTDTPSQLRHDGEANLERIRRGFSDALGISPIDIMVSTSRPARILVVKREKPFHALAVIGITPQGIPTSIIRNPSFWNDLELVQLALAVKFGVERKGDLDSIHVHDVQSRGDDRVIHLTKSGERKELIVDMKIGDERPASRPE